MKTTSIYKIMQTLIRSLIGSVTIFVAISTAAAADKTEAKEPDIDTGPKVVDWTPGSKWREKLEREGQKVKPDEKVAPPAFGRNKIDLNAKRLERGGSGVKLPLAPPSPLPEQPANTAKK